ncbi:DNA polymerase IV [Patescibacteria group bacterium]|nr:DNA polymerase IV [Patescibacteria group bacterium]
MSTAPLSIHSFPKAILHIDADAFFVSCEQALNPTLKNKPVAVGKERGIVTAISYEAKAKGVKRGMRGFEIKRICPECIILPSHYETYGLFSLRMYEIVKRFTPTVEEYSIDECFADITGLQRPLGMNYPEIAARIKRTLETELGLSFSVGLSVTKTIAKIASNWNKPSGIVSIPGTEIHHYLKKLPLERIWGIGPQTSAYLNKLGLKTALDLARKSQDWVQAKLTKPHYETWQELRGQAVLILETGSKKNYKSITRSHTFNPPTNNPQFLLAQLAKNLEAACAHARRFNLASNKLFFYLKTQQFKYYGAKIKFTAPTHHPNLLMPAIRKHFGQIYCQKSLYRATGVTLTNLKTTENTQMDLWGQTQKDSKLTQIYRGIDKLGAKYGRRTVFLATALTPNTHQPSPKLMLKRNFNIPLLGKVS